MPESYIIDWLSLLVRWLHLITGVAWIGASFYFVWLDNHLRPPASALDAERGIGGEVWSVHGGGFYHAQKYRVAPARLPETLHWFKWEAYSTWLSGMALLGLVYWYGASLYLIDPGVRDWTPSMAILASIAVIVGGWLVYDALCRSSLARSEAGLTTVLALLLSLAAYGLCALFSGRGAYMIYGAMLGSIMVGNVFFVIIPGQKAMVAAKQAERPPDPAHGIRGKQRSLHNTYFTLPVLFVMLSNHYAMTYGHALNWLLLIGMTLAGALVRIYFVARHRGRASPWPLLAAAAVLAGMIWLAAPVPRVASADDDPEALLPAVRQAIATHCAGCHTERPRVAGFSAPPKGIVLESREQIEQQAALIHQQAVVTQAMPLGNMTAMSAAERTLIERWYRAYTETDNGN